jgi:Fanconi anemia group M protein
MHKLTLDNFGLLVFDECHRAVKEYAYTKIAAFYVSQNEYPLILGMTASPGSDLKRVLEVCNNLYIEQVECRTEEDLDVKPYLKPIDVNWLRVDLPNEYLKLKALIRSMLNRRLIWLFNMGIIKSNPEYTTRKHLINVGDELRSILEESEEQEKGKIFTAIINQSLSLTIFHMLTLLETQGLFPLKSFIRRIDLERRSKRGYSILVNEREYHELTMKIGDTPLEHPKKNC